MASPSNLETDRHKIEIQGDAIPVPQIDSTESTDTALQKIRTARSVSIPPELFEKLYLSPQNVVKGDLRKTFGNPTPL